MGQYCRNLNLRRLLLAIRLGEWGELFVQRHSPRRMAGSVPINNIYSIIYNKTIQYKNENLWVHYSIYYIVK